VNTFFRICIFITLGLIIFSLAINFVEGLNIFPVSGSPHSNVTGVDNALTVLTKLENPTMQGLFILVTSVTALLAVGLSYLTASITPLGIFIFGEVFWTAWIRSQVILSYGGFIPGDFLLLFTVGALFVFIAAIIGMLTGSG